MIVALAAAVASASPASSADLSPGEESEFVALVNSHRSGAGLPPLTVHNELVEASRSWSHQMAAAGQISHANPISAGITADWQKLGENVGVGPSVASVMDAFMNSPGHRANVLDPAYTHLGVGVVREGDVLYTTHRFMQLASEPAPAPPPPPPTEAPAPPPTAPQPPPTAAPAPAPSQPAQPDPGPQTTTTTAATTTTAPPQPRVAPAQIGDLVEALVAVAQNH